MVAGFSPEQLSIAAAARRFARERIAPGYREREREGRIDRALVREIGALGFIAPELPEELGGLGAPSLTSGLITEAIGYADMNVAYLQILGSLTGAILARHAPPALALDWVPRLVGGEAVIALGLTEPRGGSDAANIALSARRDGDRYVSRGRPLVRRPSGAQADRARPRQTLVRRRYRVDPRHRQPRHAGAQPLLRHRGIEGGRPRLPREAQADFRKPRG